MYFDVGLLAEFGERENVDGGTHADNDERKPKLLFDVKHFRFVFDAL